MWKDHLSKGGNTGFAKGCYVFKTNGSSQTALSSGVLIKVVLTRETADTEIPNGSARSFSKRPNRRRNIVLEKLLPYVVKIEIYQHGFSFSATIFSASAVI